MDFIQFFEILTSVTKLEDAGEIRSIDGTVKTTYNFQEIYHCSTWSLTGCGTPAETTSWYPLLEMPAMRAARAEAAASPPSPSDFRVRYSSSSSSVSCNRTLIIKFFVNSATNVGRHTKWYGSFISGGKHVP